MSTRGIPILSSDRRCITFSRPEANAFHKTTPHYLAFREEMAELSSRERHSDLYEGVWIDSPKLG